MGRSPLTVGLDTAPVTLYGKKSITSDFAEALLIGSDNSLLISSGLVPSGYDYISLSYTGDNLTGVVYKTGGSGGTTVATLTLAYSGSNLTSVTRT